ncbi:PREDICTED: uncharacterized protein LOC108967210 [Bactrocera latifrons]|uniref:uncharacterized protein LOC108967210 n=1 Tax=Bactrocera latifrons TaxID=174628 RepID=UPI0008DCE13B|nr:PREDICTED: uncharacterized protein LOC108967210 [Bactrocera latifrons]
MAHAFYVPNQADLLRRVYLRERRLQEPRQQNDCLNNWLLMLTIFFELLRLFVQYERQLMGSCRPTRLL